MFILWGGQQLRPWQLPFVSRYWDARYNVTSSGERASNWLDMKLGTDLAQATGANQPILLPYAGTNYLWLPGVTGNNCTTPDSNALDITGDIQIDVDIAMVDWTPTSYSDLVMKWEAGQYAYALSFDTGGTGILVFGYSVDGTTPLSVSATAAPTVSDGARLKLRVTRVASDGNIRFYTSTDGTTYTQLGATVAGTSGNLVARTSPLNIGFETNATSRVINGKLYRVTIRNGIGGAIVFDADFTTVAEGATSFTESSSNAATVTINSTGAKPAQIVGRQWILGDSAAYYLQTAALTIPAPYAIAVCVQFNAWTANDVLFDGRTANSFASQQVTASPQIRMHDAGADTSTVSTTLATRYILFASQAADGTARLRLNLGSAVTGTLSATALAGLTLLADGSGANFIGAQVCAEAQCSVAPTAAQEEQLIRSIASQCGVAV